MSTKTTCSIITHKKDGLKLFDPAHVVGFLNEDTILLESADVVTKLGEKSMLFMDLALKIEARDGQVRVTALMDEALPLLDCLQGSLNSSLKEAKDKELIFYFSPLYDYLDLIEKMHAPSAFNVLRAMLAIFTKDNLYQKDRLLVGSFSYDFLDHFEKLPIAKKDIHNFPDYLFYVPFSIAIIDHKKKQASLVAHGLDNETAKKRLNKTEIIIKECEQNLKVDPCAYQKENTGWGDFAKKAQVDISDKDFGSIVKRCQDHISVGDVYQIVPSRTFSCPIKDPLLAYGFLRQFNPSPYMFFMSTKDFTLLGASPETFIKVENQKLSIRPIAGTRRRGFLKNGHFDEELDSRNQASLCLDEKELAEHMMLVDLARNDIASVCKAKSRQIVRLLSVDKFSHVMHLVSEVDGILRADFDALSAYQASMNMGTLMGAPKVRAAELLRELELTKRGFYGGAVGYIDASGNMDTAIIIRSALVQKNIAYVRAGCGVVFDSNIDFEVEETLNKAESTLKALLMASAI